MAIKVPFPEAIAYARVMMSMPAVANRTPYQKKEREKSDSTLGIGVELRNHEITNALSIPNVWGSFDPSPMAFGNPDPISLAA